MIDIKINEAHRNKLSGQNASTSDSSDSALGGFREELGLDDDGNVGESSAAEDLLEASLGDVDDGGLALISGELSTGLLRQKSPETIEID